jgi:hypothetical protein
MAALEQNCGADTNGILKEGGHFSPSLTNTIAANVERRAAVHDVRLAAAKIILTPI